MYKLSFELKKIISPIHIIEPFEMRFVNSEDLVEYELDKYYLVKSIEANGGEIQIVLEENKQINKLEWKKEEVVSFF